jgi:hypothetical protein
VEPVENPAASELTALDSLREFTCVVADYGHALITCHTVLTEKLIESSRGRGITTSRMLGSDICLLQVAQTSLFCSHRGNRNRFLPSV